MSQMPRTPDYLHIHGNLRDRVRNLETGVHPTAGETRLYDTIEPTNIALLAASLWTTVVGSQHVPFWQRRVGVVSLGGTITGKVNGPVAGPDKIGTLPVAARPNMDLRFMVPSGFAPFFTFLEVKTDGGVWLDPTDAPAGSKALVFLAGPNWTVT